MKFEIDGYNALKEALHLICAALFAENVPEGAVFDSKVVANELIVNALRYGGGRAYVSVQSGDGEIRIAVRGANAFRPPEKTECSAADAERGRGLFLVDALSLRRAYSDDEGIIVTLGTGAERT